MKKSLFTAPVVVAQLTAVALLVQGCTTYTPGRTALGGSSTELPSGTIVRVDDQSAGSTVTSVTPKYVTPTQTPTQAPTLTPTPTDTFTRFVIPAGTPAVDPGDGLKKTAVRHVPVPVPSVEAETVTTTQTPDGKYAFYVVKRGDTAGEIANRHGLTRADFTRINNLANPDRILVGQKLKVPAGGKPLAAGPAVAVGSADEGTHVVASGETLSEIAVKYSMRAADLAAINGIANPNMVRVGQKLKVAKVTGSAKPKTTTKVATSPTATTPAPKAPQTPSAVTVEPDVSPEPDVVVDPMEALLGQPAASNMETSTPPTPKAVPAAAVSSTPKSAALREHLVRENEDIFSIAIDYRVRPMDIRRENNMTGSSLTPGSVIKIPASDSSN